MSDYYIRRRDNLVEEAHRRRPPVCGAPTLVWHLGLWPKAKQILDRSFEGEDPQDARSEAEYNKRFEEWIESVNKTISLIKRLDDDPDRKYPPNSTINRQYDPKNLVILTRPIAEFQISWLGMAVECIVELHYEYITFSFFLDLDAHGQAIAELRQTQPDHLLVQIDNTLKLIDQDASGKASPSGRPDVEKLFKTFWEVTFRGAILDRAGLQVSSDVFPGEPFAKFFGIVIPAEPGESVDAFDTGRDKDNSRKVIEAYGGFISEANARADERDFIACSMLDGRAIYATAMGAKPRHELAVTNELRNVPYSDVQEVRYIIFVRPGADPYQTGRLIETVNTLETYRLFALKELRLFRRLSVFIRLYGQRVDEIACKFSELLSEHPHRLAEMAQKEQGPTDEEFTSFLKALSDEKFGDDKEVSDFILKTKDIRLLQVGLCIIESNIYDHSKSFTGGLQFRLSRSKYYTRLFKERLRDLGVQAIHPYQSYESFLTKRLFSTFDYISDIGERVASLRSRLRSILDSIQSKALVDLTVNIQRMSEYTAKQTASLLEIQHDTKIQSDIARSVGKQEYIQSRILALIAIFAFVGQVVHSDLWWWISDEARSAAVAYSAAAFLVFVLWRIMVWRQRRLERRQRIQF